MLLALSIFLIGSFPAISLRAVLQYASRVLGGSSQAQMLVTEVASINLILFCFILPSLITLISRRYHPNLQLLNLSIVRSSLIILVFGALLLSLAPSSIFMIIALGIYAMGFGVRATTLSLVTSWFSESVRTQMYNCILAVELTGMLIGEPMLQSLLAISVHLQTFRMGILFAVVAAWYIVGPGCASLIIIEV